MSKKKNPFITEKNLETKNDAELILADHEITIHGNEFSEGSKYDRAKAAYLDYVPARVIASTYGISTEQLIGWINEAHDGKPSWRSILTELEQEQSADYFTTKSHRVHELVNLSIVALRRCLNGALSRDTISLKDGANIATILGTLDKITRLDENKPTDIVDHTLPASIEEVREALLKYDPFLKQQPKVLEGVIVVDSNEKT